MPSTLINSYNQRYWWLVQSKVCEPQYGLNGAAGIPTDGSMRGYNDENGSAVRKVVMRKRIRLEEFIFLKLPGAPAAVQDVTAWYSSPGLWANFSVPLSIYGGVGGH